MSRRLAALLGAIALCTTLLCALIGVPVGGTAWANTPTRTAKAIPAPAEAVGVYPTVVEFKDALRSGQYLQTIGILNGSSEGAFFHFELAGPAAAWLHVVTSDQHLTPITQLWAPDGPAATTAVLELQVPPTEPDGTYSGLITVSAPPQKTEKKGQTSVGLGAQIGISVAVTGTELIAAQLLNAFTFPKIEVGEALPVFSVLKNLGNVALQPQFHLMVKKASGGNAVYNWHGAASATLPGQTTTYQLDWPASATETQTLGKYSAYLKVRFPSGKSIGSWSLPFQLYPYGSLHRGGKLVSLKLSNHPAAGGTAVGQASVVSTGEVQEETYFVGQLYRDGSLVQAVKSPVPLLLAPQDEIGSSGTLAVPFTVAKDGLYHLTGTANFAGAQSNIETLTFRVGPAPIPIVYEIGAAVLLVALIALIVGLVVWRRRGGGPSSWPERRHVPPAYTAARGGTLRVPPRTANGNGGSGDGRGKHVRPSPEPIGKHATRSQ
jgi:hypothetical protein